MICIALVVNEKRRKCYVDNARSRVLQVGRNGEIDKVVDRESDATELVNHFVPNESTVIPCVSDNDRPSTKIV